MVLHSGEMVLVDGACFMQGGNVQQMDAGCSQVRMRKERESCIPLKDGLNSGNPIRRKKLESADEGFHRGRKRTTLGLGFFRMVGIGFASLGDEKRVRVGKGIVTSRTSVFSL